MIPKWILRQRSSLFVRCTHPEVDESHKACSHCGALSHHEPRASEHRGHGLKPLKIISPNQLSLTSGSFSLDILPQQQKAKHTKETLSERLYRNTVC